MATDSSSLAWRLPWTEEPGGPQSVGSQRAGHDWSDFAHTHAYKKNPCSLRAGSNISVPFGGLIMREVWGWELSASPSVFHSPLVGFPLCFMLHLLGGWTVIPANTFQPCDKCHPDYHVQQTRATVPGPGVHALSSWFPQMACGNGFQSSESE